MKVSIVELRKICCNLLLDSGIVENDTKIVFEHLLEEELLGKSSHGFYRLPGILSTSKKLSNKSRKIEITHLSDNVTKVDASNTLGLVAVKIASDIAINKTKENNMAITSVTGYKGTTGALGYYARLFAKQNLISIIMCSSEYAVAPFGGKDAILGTNPISISIPNESQPIIVDFSTAAMTYGELMIAAKENRQVQLGIVIDKDGNPSTDPMDADNGAQLPMAGHKGYALGLAIEVLAGLFIGAKSGKEAVVSTDGTLIFSFKPDLFVKENLYLKNLNMLIKEIVNSSLAPNSHGIRIPGSNCFKTISEKMSSGYCDISNEVYKEIASM